MDAVVVLIDDQLREHRRHAAVAGGVADVLLAALAVRGVDDELGALRVIRRGGLQLLDVRAVARLGHGKAAGQLERRRRLQVALVVQARPELLDRATPQPELDPELDQQREVAEPDRLEAGDVGARIAVAAELDREAGRGQALGRERPHPLEHALAVLSGREPDRRLELGPAEDLEDLVAQRRIAAAEQRL